MGWVTLLWALLKRVDWRLWLLLAFACVCVFALWKVHREGVETGRSEVQGRWDAAVDRGLLEIAEMNRKNAALEATALADARNIGEGRVRDLQDELAARDRLIADQRVGTVKLRKLWQGCVSRSQAGDAAEVSGGPVPADELRAAGAADLVRIGQDADSKVKRLQEFVQVQQKLCEAVN